ncbi:MAG: immunoglobulin domain-containing protein [Phycisphaerales bacterium]|nr:immunoglobulin domain-containing protein [Phycisphaerales bacterium]
MRAVLKRGMVVLASLAGLGLVCGSASAVNVCGPITVNTTWTVANSPYVLTCDVRVLAGATLTIDPGVTVQFPQNMALIAEGGVINAIGTAANQINFASTNATLPGAGLRVQGGQIDARRANFTSLQSGISLVCCGNPFNPPLNVDHCNFTGNQAGISGYTTPVSTISNSYFSNNAVAAGQAYQIYTFCTFQANTAAFNFAESVTLEDCEIAGNTTGVSSPTGNSMIARRCHFHGNQLAMERVTHIERCLIEFNEVGVRISTPYMAFFQCNNFQLNDAWNVEMNTGSTISAPNNWWGTTSTSAIDAGIKDGFDQVGLGFLQYATPLSGDWTETSTCACTVPVITSWSPDETKYVGQTATFSVIASATGAPSYQWKRNNVALTNNGHFSGVTTPTMMVNNIYDPGSGPGWTDAGAYTCVVSNVCGTVESVAMNLTVQVCAADFNMSGIVSIQDLFDFLGAYFAGCP